MFFERAEQFRKLRTAAAQRDFNPATCSHIARAIGGMHMQHMRTQRRRRFARIKAMHNEIRRIEIDANRRRRQRLDQLQQIGAIFGPRFRGQHRADPLALAADVGEGGAQRCERRRIFLRRHPADVINHDVRAQLISELQSLLGGIHAAVEFVQIAIATAGAKAEGCHPQIQIFQHFPHLPHTCTA